MIGFHYAFKGLLGMIMRERNFRVHLCTVYYVIAFSVLYDLDRSEYAVLFVTIFLVLALECVNTVIEAVVDMKTSRRTVFGKFAKDAAAGGVLLGAIGAIAVAICLFWNGQKLLFAWDAFLASPIWICIFVIPIIPCILFIIGKKSWQKCREDKYI